MATIQVKLKNGQIVPMSHPDDWTEEQVISSIHENFPDEASNNPEIDEQIQPNQEKTGLSGIKNDFFQALSGAMKSSADFAKETPNMLEDLGGQLLEHPIKGQVHAAGQLGSSIAEMGKGLLNMPHDILSYLGKKDVIPDWLKRYNELPFTHIPEDTGLEKLLGTQSTQKSDRLLRALPELATDAALVGSLVKGGINKFTQKALKKDISGLDENISKMTEELGLTQEQSKKLGEVLREQFASEFPSKSKVGETTPSGQRVQQARKTKMIEETEPLLVEKTPEEIRGMKPDEIKKKATTDIEEAHSQLSDTLKWDENHKKVGGEIAHDIIMSDKDKASQLYQEAREHYDSSNIKIDNTDKIKDVKTVLDHLRKEDPLAPGYGTGSISEVALENSIKALENETIPARDIFDLSRTLSKQASEIRKQQFSGVTDTEFNRLKSLADKYEQEAGKLNSILEQTGDSSVKMKIKEANKLWSNYSKVKEIPEGRAVLYDKKLTSGFMDAITGDKAGRPYLRSIVDNSPALKENIIGMRYSKKSKHNDLLNPNKETQSYLNDLPHVQEKIDLLKEAKEAHPKMQELAESMKHEANIKQLEKEIKFHEDAEKKLDKLMQKEKEQGKDIEHFKKKKDELKAKLDDKKGKLKAIRNVTLKLTGLKYLSDKVGINH